MTRSNQEQSAGDYSTQIQAGSIQNTYITNVTGIDEARARCICKEEYAKARQNWTVEANVIAEQRVHELENKLIPKMIQYDASLSAFSDPAFQITLMKAQIAAASTERPEDYEMLSELLLHRVEQNTNRERRLGITKAIEIVDQIDGDALIALSLVFAIIKFFPVSINIDEGLATLDNLYGKIVAGQRIPSGIDWMERLDLLSAVRLGTRGINTFKKFEEYIPNKLANYFRTGIREGSEEFNAITEKLASVRINSGFFIPNPLKQSFVIWALSYDINSICRTITKNGAVNHLQLNEAEKAVMEEVIEIMKSHDAPDEEVKSKFWNIWDNYPHLNMIHKWWNELPQHFEITPVGVALANAYIHGIDNTVPCMY